MKKILCVDDAPTLLQLYQEELSEEGFEVILAGDGEEALRKFEKEKPHLVVMDIRMPRMDGVQLLNAMLGMNTEIPVILNIFMAK